MMGDEADWDEREIASKQPDGVSYARQMVIRVRRMQDRGGIELPAYEGDCGFDLRLAEGGIIGQGQTLDLRCGVEIALPEGTFAWVVARSSTWFRHGILVPPGIIDSGFRGELRVAMVKLTPGRVVFQPGDKVAQLLIVPNLAGQVRLEMVRMLPPAQRGQNGFGSSG